MSEIIKAACAAQIYAVIVYPAEFQSDDTYRIMQGPDFIVQIGSDFDDDHAANELCAKMNMTAAIIAFLRNCGTATPAMSDAVEAQFQQWKNDNGTNGPFIRANAFWQVMRESKADELEGMLL